MAAKGGKHTAEFFKKDKENNVFKDSVDAVDLVDSVKKRFTIADDSDNKLRSVTKTYQFNNEDKIIARLYREVIDKTMTDNKFGDMKVTIAISKIKEEIHLGHKRGFRKFPGINFGKPENRCAYLIRYAICYTGLVKKAIWDFFNENNSSCPKARDILTSNHRKVVSLGGGPGNDLIGFCSALQETSNNIEELDLKIVDINDGWISVFPEILRKASKANFGSLSALMRRVKINTGFLQRNLSEAKIFEDVTLSNILDEVDIVLMVKLVSFLPKQEVEELIQVRDFIFLSVDLNIISNRIINPVNNFLKLFHALMCYF